MPLYLSSHSPKKLCETDRGISKMPYIRHETAKYVSKWKMPEISQNPPLSLEQTYF